MKEALRRLCPSETRGLMIGLVHAKRDIIYVTQLHGSSAGRVGLAIYTGPAA
ncbi:MAG: hypothetical protein ACLQU2_07495 [Candidatus Binataceae bacterium]